MRRHRHEQPVTAMAAVLQRELRNAMQRPGDAIQPLIFLAMVVTLFPLGLGPEPDALALVAPAAIWVAALMASQLPVERLFREDYEDGSLALMMTSGQSLSLLVSSKVLAHWLLTGLPLSLLGGVVGLSLNLQADAAVVLTKALLLGTPILSLLGAVGGALTVSLPRGALLLALVLLPLYIPVLIFGTSAVANAQLGITGAGELKMLAAILCLAIPTCPMATAVALRISSS
jgi:heme exporter protein B